MPIGAFVYVWVDSIAVADDGGRHHVQKLFPLPFARGVFAVRGEQSKVPAALAGQYLTDRWGISFDEVLKTFPALLQKCHDELADHLQDRTGLEAAAQEIVLAGWSEERNAPVCMLARRNAGEPTFEFVEKPKGFVSPDPGHDPSQQQRKENIMRYVWDIASAQSIQERRRDPSVSIGGHVTVAVVGQKQVHLWNIGDA
jgi:hypothetical protein